MRKRDLRDVLPPGPRVPVAVQLFATWKRPAASLERMRRRYGTRISVQLPFQPPFVLLGPYEYPPGVSLLASAYLVHHDPTIYPDPYSFRPERFLEHPPGTYTWIPFGGGRRRCLGASFALEEMKIVLRTVVSRYELAPASDRPEVTARRSITFSPARGATVILRPPPATQTPANDPDGHERVLQQGVPC